jgi:fatty acid desaturase
LARLRSPQQGIAVIETQQTGVLNRNWIHDLVKYRVPDDRRSIYEIVVSAAPLAVLWLLAWAALSVSYILTLLLAIVAAGFLVRLFMIQHDCGHGSFFSSRPANDWVGRVIGVLTLTPYDVWRRSHATHHATSGNLDKRGIGDIDTLTVREYLALPLLRRVGYRLYRWCCSGWAPPTCSCCATACRPTFSAPTVPNGSALLRPTRRLRRRLPG